MVDSIGAVSNAAAASSSSGTAPGLTGLGDRDTFLKLLVAQVSNQDPLSPQDPIEFVSQLTQFSQLETLLGMRTSLDTIVQSLAAAPPAAADPSASGDVTP
jgi:flagellar basal-body rod modification protein FlgD